MQIKRHFTNNWPFLAASILIASALKVYVDQTHVGAFLQRYRRASVLAATGAAAGTPLGTPLCSCGTTAVILGLMAGAAAHVPWAPIVAFMVASPLTAPGELLYSAGLFGWPFALAFFGACIVLGLMGGAFAQAWDSPGWLMGQARMAAAPLYLNTEASLPLVRAMLDAGMTGGAALAFLITGAGTSMGAIAGALTIARWRVVALVILTLWLGAVLCGFLYDALLPAGIS